MVILMRNLKGWRTGEGWLAWDTWQEKSPNKRIFFRGPVYLLRAATLLAGLAIPARACPDCVAPPARLTDHRVTRRVRNGVRWTRSKPTELLVEALEREKKPPPSCGA